MPNGDFDGLSDREILILIADRTHDLPRRVDTLESISDKQAGFIRAITWFGSILWAFLTFIIGNHLIRGGK